MTDTNPTLYVIFPFILLAMQMLCCYVLIRSKLTTHLLKYWLREIAEYLADLSISCDIEERLERLQLLSSKYHRNSKYYIGYTIFALLCNAFIPIQPTNIWLLTVVVTAINYPIIRMVTVLALDSKQVLLEIADLIEELPEEE